MSFLRQLYDNYAAPSILRLFTDDQRTVVYTIGSNVVPIVGFERSKKVELVPNESGDIIKRHTMQMVFSTDCDGPYGGLSDPQLKATFTVLDELGNEDVYAVDSTEGGGYEVINATFSLVNLIRHEGVSKSFPDYRVR